VQAAVDQVNARIPAKLREGRIAWLTQPFLSEI
jgi:hypothetical protein